MLFRALSSLVMLCATWTFSQTSVPIKVWETTFSDQKFNNVTSMCQTLEKYYIVVGYSNATGGNTSGNLLVVKFDTLGNQKWSLSVDRINGTDSVYLPFFVSNTADSGWVIVDSRCRIVRFSKSGGIRWSKKYGFQNYYVGTLSTSVSETKDGGYIVGGYIRTAIYIPNVNNAAFLFRLDSNGDSLWQRQYLIEQTDPSKKCTFSDVLPVSDGGFMAVGQSGASLEAGYAVRTRPDGVQIWGVGIPSIVYPPTCILESASKSFLISSPTEMSFVDSAGNIGGTRPLSLSTYPSTISIFGSSMVAAVSNSIRCIGSQGNDLWSRSFQGFSFSQDGLQTPDTISVICAGTLTRGQSTQQTKVFDLLKVSVLPPPAILTAVASDSAVALNGIDSDDHVSLSFSNSIGFENPNYHSFRSISASNIDSLLPLNNGHSWLCGAGVLRSIVWSSDSSKLRIALRTDGGLPSITVGDTITFRPNGTKAILIGSFDKQITEIIVSASISQQKTNVSRQTVAFSISGQLIRKQFISKDFAGICIVKSSSGKYIPEVHFRE